jgi:hypothetical protein
MFIVGLLCQSNSIRQFEAGQLETIFQECNPHDEEGAQLRLPAADLVA